MRRRPTTVYFIRPVGMLGPVKVGVSHSPDGRRETLETWSPFPLEIIAEIPGDRVLERRFHALFHKSWERREWFTWTPELGQVVMAINDGTFDIETLPSPMVIKHLHYKRRTWTPEQKRRAALNRRVNRAGKAVGYYYSGNLWRMNLDDPAVIAELEAFIADPVTHGSPCAWMRKAA